MNERVRISALDGLLVSKAGFDAETADLPDLNFSPDYEMQRVIESGSVAFTSSGGFFDQVVIPLLGSYAFPPAVRYALSYSNMNGGDSDHRDDMQPAFATVGSNIVAASPCTLDEIQDGGGNIVEMDFNVNNLVRVTTTAIRVVRRVGDGTFYYEVLREL